VNAPLAEGEALVLEDQRRKLPVRIVADIRPDRTARHPLKSMI
jgi:hypothetical protein